MMEMYDIHTHILYGVDDGPGELEESIEIIRSEIKQGVSRIILTPHYRADMFETDMATIREHYEILKKEVQRLELPVKLALGCEFHANMDMVEMLEKGERPLMGDTYYVLTEFSGAHTALYIRERCSALLRAGFIPVIAHAERSPVIRKNDKLLTMLVNMGVLIQINAGSVIGKNGLAVKWWCGRMIRKHLVHVVASDVHNTGNRPCYMKECAKYLLKKYDDDIADSLLKPDWMI